MEESDENVNGMLQRLLSEWSSEDDSICIKGLSEWTLAAWKLASGQVDELISDEADLLKAYLRGSPEAIELKSLLGTTMSTTKESLVIEALTQTLLCTKKLNLRAVGTGIIRSLLRSHMKPIYRRLSLAQGGGGAPAEDIQAALHLLSTMANHGSAAAHEIQGCFNFGLKALVKLPTLRKKGSGKAEYEAYRKVKDVRALYVDFLMALLRKGDTQVRQSLLSAGDILGNILSGLSADSPLVISTVLETLQKCVVDNDGISRNAKLLLLSNKNLERLLGLYARASAPDGGEKSSPAELGHAFLLHATSMPGIGICYKDEGLYPPSGKKGVKLYNKILVSFIEALRPIEDQKQQALLLEILKACPELIKPYGAKLNSLPIDQLTHPSWALSIELVLRILLLPVPKDFGSQVWYPPPTSHLLEICLPSCLSKPLLSKLFQHQDLSLRKTGCLLTATSLEKLQTVVTELDRLGQSVYPAHTQQWSLAKEELLDQVRRGLPEFQSLISLLGILGTTEVSPSSTETTSIGVSMSEDDLVNLKRRLYQLLASYQTLFPATVRESRFSASKVLSRDMHRLPLDLQYSVLSLVQSSNELKWWQNIEGETSLSVLRALLDYMVSSTQDEIQGLIGTSIQHILSASFPFQSHSAECVIWLSSLSQSSLADQEAILPFIDTILRNAQQEMYKIMDSQFPFYVAERERQRLGTDSMDFDSETGYAPPIGYSTMCLLDGFRHLSQKQKGSTKNLEAIVRYICRVALGIMRSTGTLADMMFSIMRAFLVDLSAMELDAISPAHLGGFVNECLLCLLKYCESYPGTQHADVLPSSEERPAVNPLKLLKDKTATGKLIHVSVKDLKDILSCVSQGSDGLNREWCHELVARLTQTQIGFNELSSLQIPGSLENHIPLSLMLDFSVASSKHAHVLGPRLLQTVKTLTDKSIQAFVFNQAVLELQYGFRISKMTLKQASFLIEVLLSLVQHGSETLLLNQGLQSLLHLCLSQEDWLLSASHVTRSLISLIYSCVREKNQFVVNALRPSLSLIESKITSCLQTSGSEFLQSSMRSDILSIFQATGNEHLIMTAIGCVLENQNIKNVDRLLIDLLKEAVNQQESIDASTFSLVFDKYLNSRSKDLGRIILSLISNVMGLGSEVWNQIEGCRTKNVHANYVPELPVDLTSLITFEHLEKLSKKWDAMSARIASCFAFSNATLRESLYILLENPSHDLEPAVSQIFVGSMLELNVQTEDQFNSIRAWKKSISPLSKIVTECLWGQNFPSSFSRMLESISGKCDIDHLNVRILALGAPVFPPQIDLIAELENNLSVTECTLKTCTVLHEYMPVFVAYSKGRSELILKLLVTTLRLLRGCIMAVKKLTGGTDSSNATEEFLDRVVPLIESIKYLLSLLKESSEILDVTSYHDHFIKFFNVALKTHYTSARMMDLLGCLLQIAGHLSIKVYAPEKLLEMVYTHSKFETIFGKKDEEEKPLSTKEASKTSLVRFIFMIMKSAPGKCCQLHYLQKLVDSYKGTMSTSDRWILKLAHLYEEQAGISSLELLLNRWSKETDECDLLSLLSSEKMLRTVNEFDFSRNVESLISEDEPEFGADLTSMYDISFLLPFTIGLLEKVSEKQMDLLPLFLTNLIGLAFVATSSDCEGTRRAALQILTKAEYLLLVSEVKELSSMTLLMEAFRNAVSSEGSQTPRIPSVLAFFAAQSILILMKPESSMYPLVHRFILQRPIIDLQDLPMFYEMVYSSTDTNRRERIWIIRLLSHGISNSLDLKLYKRRHAVDILISLYDNPISDMQLKKIIFETVAKAVKNPTVALDLIQKNGLTSFLASCSLEINIHSSDQLDTFVGILHSTLDCIPPQAISVSKSITLLAGTLLIRVSEMILAQDLHAFNPENGHIFNKLLQVLSGRAVVLECSDLTRIVEASKRLEGGAADSLISFLGSVRSLNMKDRHFLSLAIEFLSISYQTTSSESLILWLIAIRLNSRDTSFETLSVLHKKEWNRFMVHLNLLLQLGRVRNSGGLVRACITLMAMMLRDSGLSSPLTEDQFAKVESPRGILASSTTLLGDETDEVIFSLLRTRLFV